MADAKISALPSATTPLAGTETLPVVQSGATKKVAVSNLTLGRTMQASAIASSSTTIGTVNNAYTVYYSSGYSGEGVIGDFVGYTGVKF